MRQASFRTSKRRTKIHVRELFHFACELTASLFDTQQGFSDPPMYLFAYRLLRKIFPNMPPTGYCDSLFSRNVISQ
jgi:hypothetical protein